MQIVIPSLRERKEDIPLLADFFLKQYRERMGKNNLRIDSSAYELLKNYHWPGNVRELENVMERIVNFSSSEIITKEDVRQHILVVPNIQKSEDEKESNFNDSEKSMSLDDNMSRTKLQQAEKEMIFNSLKRKNGNIAKAAEELGIGKRTMYRKCEQYGINYKAMRK